MNINAQSLPPLPLVTMHYNTVKAGQLQLVVITPQQPKTLTLSWSNSNSPVAFPVCTNLYAGTFEWWQFPAGVTNTTVTCTNKQMWFNVIPKYL